MSKSVMNNCRILHKVCSMLRSLYRFYVEGFRSMTIGRTLWMIILIKLVVIFAVLKVFFFPNVVKERSHEGGEAEYVASQLTSR